MGDRKIHIKTVFNRCLFGTLELENIHFDLKNSLNQKVPFAIQQHIPNVETVN